MKKLYLTGMLFFLISGLNAQDLVDALRYSQQFNGGTARSVSLGGAFGAFGGDFGTLSSNPAGLGVYRMSEITITPTLFKGDVSSRYFGSLAEDYKYNFNLNNLGVVLNYTRNKKEGFIGGSFAFGYNRTNNFNNYTIIDGRNHNNSIADYFLYYSYDDNGDPIHPDYLDEFYERLAFDAYIIDTFPDGTGDYFTEVPYPPDNPIDQRKTIETGGSMGEWVISAAGNYAHKVYFGATFGIQSLRYSEYSNHEEFNNTDPATGFDWLDFHQTLDTRGTGYNFKFGFIFKPIQIIRIGAAFHSPTAYYIEEEYYSTMESNYRDRTVYPTDIYGNRLDAGTFDYKLITPFKFVGSAGVTIFKIALLSAEFDYIDYSTMRFRGRGTSQNFTDRNNDIRQNYQPVTNIRGGGEVRLGNFALRAGMGYYGSPYKSPHINENADRINYTGGFGFRDKNFFIDLAYSYLAHSENYILYQYGEEGPNSPLDITRQKFMATIGIRF